MSVVLFIVSFLLIMYFVEFEIEKMYINGKEIKSSVSKKIVVSLLYSISLVSVYYVGMLFVYIYDYVKGLN